MVGNAQLLRFSRRVKASHKRIWVALVWMVAARLEAQGRMITHHRGNSAWLRQGRGGGALRTQKGEGWPVLVMDGKKSEGCELKVWASRELVVSPS